MKVAQGKSHPNRKVAAKDRRGGSTGKPLKPKKGPLRISLGEEKPNGLDKRYRTQVRGKTDRGGGIKKKIFVQASPGHRTIPKELELEGF